MALVESRHVLFLQSEPTIVDKVFSYNIPGFVTVL